ncbi:hypothetical protein FIU93_08735 [Labrenzia sp. THAF35]|uniref:hypothetical protein n=1 Tax=Labrenzia sp. THAF35 TaxID=2587854 RepID=UPI001268827B|nr:hypothetical protein [Labrenzia sp. THAF35]QFT66862.1 hypothetical protein FIU93_08735 [Labrenzia sp. THAF35]
MKGEVRSMVECGPDIEAAFRDQHPDIQLTQPLTAILVALDEGNIDKGDTLSVGGLRVNVLATGRSALLADGSRNSITVFSELPIQHMPDLAPDRTADTPGALVTPWEEN